jgi:hypothetical protein
LILALAVLLGSAAGAAAQEYRFENSSPDSTLIELYTSEGCSSCPPAEAWVSSLANSPALWKTVFPVAFHITYWDDQGWTDSFAQPAFTQRQRNYAARFGQDSVYTPEFIVNGREWRGWFHGEAGPKATPGTRGRLSLTIRATGPSSALYVPLPGEHPASCTLYVASLATGTKSEVAAGENAGRTLRHDFLALKLQSFPMTATGSGFTAAPVLAGDDQKLSAAAACWVSLPDGQIAQAAGGWTSPGH